MTRIALTNIEPIRLQQLQTQSPTGGSVASLAPGDIVTAQVVRSLGEGRFLLNMQGAALTATSNARLAIGQQLTLQVSKSGDGQASVHLLTLAEGAVAESGGKAAGHEVGGRAFNLESGRGTPQELARQLDAAFRPESQQAMISERVAQALESDGPLQRLLAARPDLTPRVEALLTKALQRPAGMAQSVENLQTELAAIVAKLPPGQQQAIQGNQANLASQLFPPELLERPDELARNLAEKFETLARGLEASVSRELAKTDAANAALAKTQPPPASPSEQALASEAKAVGDKPVGRQHTNADATVIQRTFEGDLKGQLLELRSQLKANRQPGANIEQALARTDALIEQVSAQQVRNLSGLNQFAYAEIPVDPRTGIQEARLQVFYRNRNRPDAAAEVDRFTIALFLNMSRLGDVMTVVSSIEGSMSVAFTVKNEEADRLLAEHSDSLRDALANAGHPGAMVTVQRPAPVGEKGETMWDDFLDLPTPPGSAGRRLDSEV